MESTEVFEEMQNQLEGEETTSSEGEESSGESTTEREVHFEDPSERPGSSIPLANNMISPNELKEFEEQRDQEQQEIIEQFNRVRDENEYLESQKHQIGGNIVKEIAKEVAQNRRDDLRNSLKNAPKRLKEEQQMNKLVNNQLLKENILINVNKLNSYSKKFKGKINYKFKTNYHVSMNPELLQKEVLEVELLINSQDVPSIMQQLFLKTIELIEIGGIYFGLPTQNLSSDFDSNIKSGYFEREFEQLAIEYAYLFARPPLERLGYKSLWITLNRILTNYSGITSQENQMLPPNITEETYLKSQDL